MNGEAIISVSAAVVALTQLLKWAGLDDSKGPLAVLVASLLGVAFWGWSTGDVTRASAFGYFAGWIAVMTSSAGVYGFTRSTGDSLTKMRSAPVVLLAIVLSGAMLAGCGGNPPPRIAPLPAQVDVADRNVKAVAGNLQQLLTMAAEAANTVSKIEDEAAKSGVIPISADAAFDRAMREYADASDKASNGVAAAALQGWPQLRALVQPVLDKGQAVIDAAYQMGAIKSKVTSYLSQLGSVLSAAVGEFMFGGAR